VALWVAVAPHPLPLTFWSVSVTPPDGWAMNPVVGTVPLKYVLLSLKNASWALVRLRKSVIIADVYALPFVFENFGIAIAARTLITTTTISNSIRVKPPWDR
jgi:hypothetical protein